MKQIRKLNSYKSVILRALIQGSLDVFICVVFELLLLFIFGGETYINKDVTYDSICGVPFYVVTLICGIVSAIPTIFLLRYNKTRFLITYLILSVIFYIFFAIITVLFIIDDNFDLLSFLLCPTPIGFVVGTLISIIINIFIKS